MNSQTAMQCLGIKPNAIKKWLLYQGIKLNEFNIFDLEF